MNTTSGFLAGLKHRWDISPAERSTRTFRETLALLNLRRVELAGLLAIGNDVIALALGHVYSGIVLEMLLVPVFVAIAALVRRRGSLRAQEITGAAFVLVGLLLTQFILAQVVARTGRISSGYSIRLLTTTLLFVLPPRTWATLLAVVFASYMALVVTRPLNPGAQV